MCNMSLEKETSWSCYWNDWNLEKKKKKSMFERTAHHGAGCGCFFLSHQAQSQGVEVGSLPPGWVQDALLSQWQRASLCRSSCLAGPGRRVALLCPVRLTGVASISILSWTNVHSLLILSRFSPHELFCSRISHRAPHGPQSLCLLRLL